MAEAVGITDAEYEAAIERGRHRGPRAISARYDRGRGRIVVRLDTGLELAFAPREAQGLEVAKVADLAGVEVVGAGTAIYFPTLDEGLSIEGLLAGRLGSDKWMAARRLAKTA